MYGPSTPAAYSPQFSTTGGPPRRELAASGVICAWISRLRRACHAPPWSPRTRRATPAVQPAVHGCQLPAGPHGWGLVAGCVICVCLRATASLALRAISAPDQHRPQPPGAGFVSLGCRQPPTRPSRRLRCSYQRLLDGLNMYCCSRQQQRHGESKPV